MNAKETRNVLRSHGYSKEDIVAALAMPASSTVTLPTRPVEVVRRPAPRPRPEVVVATPIQTAPPTQREEKPVPFRGFVQDSESPESKFHKGIREMILKRNARKGKPAEEAAAQAA
jgi:hypothetical protein